MIRIYGTSDDIVEIDGDVSEELSAYTTPRVITVGDANGGLCVVVEYAPAHVNTGGNWRIAVELIGEDVPIPWPVSMEVRECPYSPTLVIDCPPGTPVTWDKQVEDEDD
jgi:hypothetical protein